jgi:hypothetical protein
VNTYACEQLNVWLGGLEIIVKKIISGNFDWFLHTMLFYHTQQVIKKQKKGREREEEEGGGKRKTIP